MGRSLRQRVNVCGQREQLEVDVDDLLVAVGDAVLLLGLDDLGVCACRQRRGRETGDDGLRGVLRMCELRRRVDALAAAVCVQHVQRPRSLGE